MAINLPLIKNLSTVRCFKYHQCHTRHAQRRACLFEQLLLLFHSRVMKDGLLVLQRRFFVHDYRGDASGVANERQGVLFIYTFSLTKHLNLLSKLSKDFQKFDFFERIQKFILFEFEFQNFTNTIPTLNFSTFLMISITPFRDHCTSQP